jgi:hypothetical protein
MKRSRSSRRIRIIRPNRITGIFPSRTHRPTVKLAVRSSSAASFSFRILGAVGDGFRLLIMQGNIPQVGGVVKGSPVERGRFLVQPMRWEWRGVAGNGWESTNFQKRRKVAQARVFPTRVRSFSDLDCGNRMIAKRQAGKQPDPRIAARAWHHDAQGTRASSSFSTPHP